jgi:S-DNA-T family DNA segregation ATPase FtsK/SpoIIIE
VREERRPEDAPPLYAVPDPERDGEPGRDVAVRGETAPVVPEEDAVVRWEEPAPPATRPRFVAVIVVRTARTVANHDPTRTVVKTTARNAAYVPVGAGVVLRRLWEAKTNSRYERILRAAEAAGNWEALAEWADRAEQARERRHRRRMDWLAAPFALAKTLAAALATVVGCLILLGIVIAVADHNVHKVGAPLMAVIHLVRLVAIVVAVVWGPLVLAAPFLLLATLWHIGRTSGAGPAWLATSADDDDLVIDENTIARALEALRIPQITAYFKQGLPLQYLTPARRDGRGTHAVVRLPAGVTADRIARRRADLATGLHRLAKETWPSTGSEAGILDLWIADKGALAEGAGPYPLLSGGTVDVFKGVPLGKTLRGDPILAPLMERNTLAGGMPGQGKSSAARALLAGVALDPTAEIWINVPDTNFDFELFKRRATRYVMGAEDERIKEILHDLRDLYAEVQDRGQILIQQQEPAVTRRLADADIGLHPLFYLLEEAHLAIQHKQFGKEIAQLLIDIVKLGRKRGIHVIVSTQAPTKDSMPRDVTRNCSNGIAFAVGDHVANDALLGQGAYSAGHRATELIPGTDKGTAVCKGLTGERSDIVQVYFIAIEKNRDELTPIIDRAMVAIEARGKGVPGRRSRPRRVERRDLLKDLDAVLGEESVPIADVPALLARHAPGWAPYRSMTGKALRALLEREHGIRVPSTGNRYPLDPALVRDALARRS